MKRGLVRKGRRGKLEEVRTAEDASADDED